VEEVAKSVVAEEEEGAEAVKEVRYYCTEW